MTRHLAADPAGVWFMLVGYLRTDADPQSLQAAIEGYAYVAGLGMLIAVHHDPASTTADGSRPGLNACVRAIHSGAAHALLVPTRAHLADDQTSRAELIARITAVGGLVHYVDPLPTASTLPVHSAPELAPVRRGKPTMAPRRWPGHRHRYVASA